MPKGWSRIVWATPGTERKGKLGQTLLPRLGGVYGQNLGPSERQRLGLEPGGAGATVMRTCFPGGRHSTQPTGYVG